MVREGGEGKGYPMVEVAAIQRDEGQSSYLAYEPGSKSSGVIILISKIITHHPQSKLFSYQR